MPTDRRHPPPTVRLERPYVRLVGTERALTWGSAQVGVGSKWEWALLGSRLKWEWALRVRYASAWADVSGPLQAWRSRTSTRSSSTLRRSCRAPIRSLCHLIPDGYHRVPTSRALCAVGYRPLPDYSAALYGPMGSSRAAMLCCRLVRRDSSPTHARFSRSVPGMHGWPCGLLAVSLGATRPTVANFKPVGMCW